MLEIRHRHSDRVLLEVEAETLERANLSGAYLIHANLRGANMRRAVLPFANLSIADLQKANLGGANLRGANLTEANLSGANLAGVNLTGATLSLTVFAGCANLHEAIGLDEVVHSGPSEIDEATLSAGVPHLSNVFLRGVGFTWSEIADMRRRYPTITPTS